MKYSKSLLNVGAPVVLIGLILIGWQYVANNFATVLPRVDDVVGDVFDRPDFYVQHIMATLWQAMAGFVIGTGIALVLAILMVSFKPIHAAVMPVVTLLHVTPIVAIAPALIVAFGFGAAPHIIVAAIMALFPMLLNALSGFQTVDPQAKEVFSAMSAGKVETFLKLQLPSSLPFLFTGARLAITGAMVGQVISEFFGSVEGLGAVITSASSTLDLPTMWAAILISAFVSLILMALVGLVEKLVVRW